jgi:hypothetical protein
MYCFTNLPRYLNKKKRPFLIEASRPIVEDHCLNLIKDKHPLATHAAVLHHTESVRKLRSYMVVGLSDGKCLMKIFNV